MQSALAEKINGPFVSADVIESDASKPGTVSSDNLPKLIIAATRAEGFLGLETSRNEKGAPITRTYWTDADKARMWSELTGTHPITEQHRGRAPATARAMRVKKAMANLIPTPQKLVVGVLGNRWD